jgi:hypothetical protein
MAVLRKAALLDVNNLSKANKTKLRKHFNTKTRSVNALKELATQYNEILKFQNLKVKLIQKSISDVKRFDKAKTQKTKTYNLHNVDHPNLDSATTVAFLEAITKLKERYLIRIGDRRYALTPGTIDNIVKLLTFVEEHDATQSDEEIYQTILEGEYSFTVEKVRETKKTIEGAFFPEYHNLKDVDLTSLQIFENKEQANYNDNCFIHAVIQSGVVDDKTTEALRASARTREMPMKKIQEIAQKHDLYITVQRLDDKNHLKHYGDKSHPRIDIGLINEHYFLKKTMSITSFAMKNYAAVKDQKDWWKIEKMKGLRYEKSNKRFINSFDVVRLLMENKETLLRPIPMNDLLETPYLNTARKIHTLEYNKTSVTTSKYQHKTREGTNYYCDFETYTQGERHVAYLCWFVTSHGKRKVFHGEKCGLQMLAYICQIHLREQNDKGPKINFIFHNAKYDFRFLYEYLDHVNIIERGGSMLRARGQFMFKNRAFRIVVQDSYAFIATRLEKFGGMFNLPVQKEVLPYDLYSKETVERRFIPVQECVTFVEYEYEKRNIGKYIDENEKKAFVNVFLTNCKKWGCIEKNHVDIIEYSSRYCEMDCVVLQQGYDKFREWLLEVTGLDVDCYVSVSSLVHAYYQQQGVYDDVYMVSGHVLEFIQRAMVGGRTMLSDNTMSRFGFDESEKDKYLADFDAVSLYPSAMSRLGGYLRGKPKVINNLSYEFLAKQDGYYVEIEVTRVGIKRAFPLMSEVTEKGIRHFSNEMVGKRLYVDKTSLEDMLQFQEVDFEVVRGYYYDEGRNPTLGKCVNHLFETRKMHKKNKNPIESVFKLMLNSSYGKTLLKPIDEETKYVKASELDKFIGMNYNYIKYIHKINDRSSAVKVIKPTNDHYNYCSCGVEVLSMSKRIMNEVMCLAEDIGKRIYYQDTDSMHIGEQDISDVADAYRVKYDRELIGSGMGQFHTDFGSDVIKGEIKAKKSIFLGKKCYIDMLEGLDANGDVATDYHIRLKGVPNASILHLAQQEGCDVLKLFEGLFDGESKLFDLLCGGKKVSFEFSNAMTVSSRQKFERRIQFC